MERSRKRTAARKLEPRTSKLARLEKLTKELKEDADLAALEQENAALRRRLADLENEWDSDAVVARVKSRLWHSGDLKLLRSAFLPETRSRRVKGRALVLSDLLMEAPAPDGGDESTYDTEEDEKAETSSTHSMETRAHAKKRSMRCAGC